MELLIILLGELIFAPFVAALTALIQIIALAVELLLELAFGRKRPPRAASQSGRKKRHWLRWVLLTTTGTTTLACFIVGTFFVPNAVGWIVGNVESRTGIDIDYSDVSGNLFFGEIVFDKLSARRSEHPTSEFDITFEQLAVSMNFLSALSSEASLSHVSARGVRGNYSRIAKPDPKKPRRRFAIDHLTVRDLEMRIADRTRTQADLEATVVVNQAQCEPLRSRYALFDVLLRSDIDGQIDGGEFRVTSDVIDGGRRTSWRANDLPLELAARWIGGPLAWIVSGSLDVHVDDEWRRSDTASIDSHWRLTLRDVRAEVPDGMGVMKSTAARAAVAWLNHRNKAIVIPFDLTIHEQEFRDLTSASALFEKAITSALATVERLRSK